MHDENIEGPVKGLALITQDRGLEKVLERLSRHLGYPLRFYESCGDFTEDLKSGGKGVVIVDASVCSQARLMDLQMVLNDAEAWQVIYLPLTGKKSEVKEAVSVGAFGCLHKPVSEQEIRQMLQSALGM
jgi:FixJ family two-component response regulator